MQRIKGAETAKLVIYTTTVAGIIIGYGTEEGAVRAAFSGADFSRVS